MPAEKWMDEDLARVAASNNCTIEEMRRRWIIRQGRSFYVIGEDGEYKPPITKDELAQSLLRDLARMPIASQSPAWINWFKPKGDDIVRKSVEDLLFDHCTVAREVVADLAISRSYYDPTTETFYEAVCPLAVTPAEFNEQIDRWLRLLGGDKQEKLLDWLATLTRLDRPSCALLITGEPGAGKELLAQGLARRWKRAKSPTDLGRVLGDFNEDLAHCPLVFCDENLPPGKGGKKNTLADLRSMIASSSRTLARKFLSNAYLVGAIRLILAENGSQMLCTQAEEEKAERASMAVRFLHVRVDGASGEYLQSIGGRSATETWVAGGLLARHVAWLEQNRVVAPGSRFLVEGDAEELQKKLLVCNQHASLILEWLVKYLDSAPPITPMAIACNGQLLVNATAVQANWNQHVHSDFPPSTTRIGLSLRALAKEEQRHRWVVNNKTQDLRYYSIDPTLLYAWSQQNQISSPEALQSILDRQIDLEELKRGVGSPRAPGASTPSNGAAAPPPSPKSKTSKSLLDS